MKPLRFFSLTHLPCVNLAVWSRPARCNSASLQLACTVQQKLYLARFAYSKSRIYALSALLTPLRFVSQTGPKPFAASRARRAVQSMPLAMPYMYGQAYGMGAGMYTGMYGAQAGALAGAGYAGAMPAGFPQFQGSPASTSGAGGGMIGHPAAMAGMYPQGMAMGYYGMPTMVPSAGHGAGPGPGTAASAAGPAGSSGGGDMRHRSPWRAVVHNLPWETTNAELLDAFNMWNPQSAHILKDRKTGYSKCAHIQVCHVAWHDVAARSTAGPGQWASLHESAAYSP